MAHVGRAIRQQMRDEAQERKHPEWAKEREVRRQAGEQANREMMERFAPLTVDNAQAAVAWQTSRIQELIAAATK